MLFDLTDASSESLLEREDHRREKHLTYRRERGINESLGLKRAESKGEREKEEREKKRNNERGERNSRVKKY